MAVPRSDEDWAQQGYKGYGGMAWYRFQVIVPAGLDHVSLYLPLIMTCYEVYADGKLIGTFGKMPPNRVPYAGGPNAVVYELPAGSGAERTVKIAVRVWHWPGWVMYYGGGPQVRGARVGDTDQIQSRSVLVQSYGFRYDAGFLILGLLQTLAGVGALALFLLQRKEREYLWFGLMMLFNAITYWIEWLLGFHVWNVELRDFVLVTGATGIWFASIAFYQVLLRPKRTWLFRMAVAAGALNWLDALVASLTGSVLGVWLDTFIAGLCGVVLNAWIITVIFNGVRRKSPDARLLLAPAILTTGLALFEDVTSVTFRLGWQSKISDYAQLNPETISDHSG